VERIGVEGTGTYGAGLARFVRAYGLPVVAVNRPDRSLRRRRGKSDPIDAQAAPGDPAGVAVTAPKTREGQVEMIRVLRVARRGALKARVAAAEQLYGVLYSVPEELRQPLLGLKTNRAWLRQHGTTTRIARRGIESSTRPRRKIVRKIPGQ
jgi:transposase